MVSARVLVCTAVLLFLAVGVADAGRAKKTILQWWKPPPPKNRICPILECVTLKFPTYNAYLGYENLDGSEVTIPVDSSDNVITGFGVNFNGKNKCPRLFRLPRIVPGRPGRTQLYPNNEFMITLPYFSIGFWFLSGRILIITQFGPKCTAPDRKPPTFTNPAGCKDTQPLRVTLPALPGSDWGNFTRCFSATDDDSIGSLVFDPNGFPRSNITTLEGNCFPGIPLPGLGEHRGSMDVRDRSSNLASCPVIVTVVDREAPVLSPCTTVSTDITDTLATVFTAPRSAVTVEADDNDPAYNPTQKVNYAISGATTRSGTGDDAAGVFNLGVSTVTWSSQDAALNTATRCIATVTITDGAKPRLTCPASVVLTPNEQTLTAAASMVASAVDTLSPYMLSFTRTYKPSTIASTKYGAVEQSFSGSVTGAKATSSSIDGSKNGAVDAAYYVGTSTLTFTATDKAAAANSISCTVTVTVSDPPAAPTLACPMDVDTTTGAGLSYAKVSAAVVVASGNTAGAAYSSTVRLNGGAVMNGLTSLDYSNYPFAVGTTTVTVTIMPVIASQQSSCSFSVMVSDREAPSLTCPSVDVVTVPTTTDLAVLSVADFALLSGVTATASDNVGVTVSLQLGTTKLTASAAAGDSAVLALPSQSYPLGDTTYTFSALDTSGNVATSSGFCSGTIRVRDEQKPVITCPAALSLTTDVRKETVTVLAGAATATATDNVGVASISNSFTTGGSSAAAEYPVGTTTVTYTARDAAGNEKTCTQTVVVAERNYCATLTCVNGGLCKPVLGTAGHPIDAACDCSQIGGCYTKNAAEKRSGWETCAVSPFPFSNVVADADKDVAACDAVTIVADAANCAASTPFVTRAWKLVSASATDNDVPIVLGDTVAQVQALLTAATAAVADRVTFPAGTSVLVPGVTYHIELEYYDSVSQSTNAVAYSIQKKGEVPTLSGISGPSSPYTIETTEGAATSIPLTAENPAYCGVEIAQPKYTWALAAGSAPFKSGVTGFRAGTDTLPTVIIELAAIDGAKLYIFEVTLTDQFGQLSSTATYSIEFEAPLPPVTPTCKPTTGLPYFPEATPFTLKMGSNAPMPLLDYQGVRLPDFDGRVDNVFDASGIFDPGCATAERPLDFRWQIFLANDVVYTSRGATGYRTPKLTLLGNMFPATTFTVIMLTVISTVQESPLDFRTFQADYVFKFRTGSSQITLAIYNSCRTETQACDTCTCKFAAGLPTTEPTRKQWATMAAGADDSSALAMMPQADALAGWTFKWTSTPAMDLTPYGGDTDLLDLPTMAISNMGAVYTFTCVATPPSDSEYTSVVATRAMQFFSSAPTSSVSAPVTVSPLSGEVLAQKFVVDARGFTGASALSYAFKYMPASAEPSSTADEVSLTSLGWRAQQSVYLPAGQWRIVAYVYTTSGAVTRVVSTDTVTVTEASTAAVSRACWVLDMADSLLANAEAQQANTVSLLLVSYLSDYLNDPSLKASTVTCNGIDRSPAVQGLASRFMKLLAAIMNTSQLDSTQSAMLSSAMLKISTTTSATSGTTATDTAKLVSDLVSGMGSGGATGSTLSQTQSNVLRLVSQLVSQIDDCSVLDSLDLTTRNMFSATLGSAMPGTSAFVLSADNVQLTATSVWANKVQAVGLGETLFSLPAAALASTVDATLNVNMINYIDAQVKKCRGVDINHAPVSVISDIFSVEVVTPSTSAVHAVSGLSTPVTFTMPVVGDTATGSDCGVGQGQLQCSWWNAARGGWSTTGCSTTGTQSLPSGLVGVSCACSRLGQFAITRSSPTCLDAKHVYGFRVMVAIYAFLLAIAGGLFFRTIRTTHLALRENMVFTLMICVACVVRMVCATHYSQYWDLPTGMVDVLMVIPFSILYWINGHFFAEVRMQRHASTESRVRWRVEPVLRLVQLGVFLGMLVLLAGLGLSESSQAQLAVVCVRAIALTFLVANIIFFGYSCAIVLGFTSGRSEKLLTRSLVAMSCACVLESCFWGAWPVSGNSLFPCCGFDLVAIGVLLYKYRDPIGDKRRSSARASEILAASAGLQSEIDTTDTEKRTSALLPLDKTSPRRPSTALPAVVDATAVA